MEQILHIPVILSEITATDASIKLDVNLIAGQHGNNQSNGEHGNKAGIP
jgi:hypothetical protein